MIKRFLFLISFPLAVWAQDDIDAMRYSQTGFYGDARYMAMGGSFGALGANMSCMNFNPAGIAVYRSGEFVATPGIIIQNSSAQHYGNNSTDFGVKINISNIGFVSAWEQKNPYPATSKMYPKWNERNAFGISYTRLADFNINTSIGGITDTTSIINNFVNSAQGVYPSNLNGTFEWLAYQTYLINPNSDYVGGNPSDSNHYQGMMLPGIPIRQTKEIKQSGRIGELAFSFAHSFDDKIYAGATLGIPRIKYSRLSNYMEDDYKKYLKPFDSLRYEEQLATEGTGFNLKAGVLYRAGEKIRLGAYIHSPTIFNLTDNYGYKLEAYYDTAITSLGDKYKAEYEGFFKYKFYTPARGGASIAYIHNRLFAFNADVEYVGYATARYKDEDNYLRPVNLTIQKKYKGVVNARAGIEFNLDPIIVRAGYAGYSSPFGSFTGKFSRSSFSTGIGFKRKKNTYFDVSGIYTRWSEDYYLYDPKLVASSTLNTSVFYLVFTFGIKFN